MWRCMYGKCPRLLPLTCLLAALQAATGGRSFPSSPPPQPSVDLRPEFEARGLTPREQGGRGTCSVFAVTQAMEYAAAGMPDRAELGNRLSVEYLNWASNVATRNQLDGGFFSDLWEGYTSLGICEESEMPYQPVFDPASTPTDGARRSAGQLRGTGLVLHWIKRWDASSGLADDGLASLKHVIASGWPVCAGLRWPKDERWNSGVLVTPPPAEVFDGHSVLLVGYRDDRDVPGGGVLFLQNSSGPARHGAMTYEYARAYTNDAVWIEAPGRAPGWIGVADSLTRTEVRAGGVERMAVGVPTPGRYQVVVAGGRAPTGGTFTVTLGTTRLEGVSFGGEGTLNVSLGTHEFAAEVQPVEIRCEQPGSLAIRGVRVKKLSPVGN